MWVKVAQLPCWMPRDQQVTHQRNPSCASHRAYKGEIHHGFESTDRQDQRSETHLMQHSHSRTGMGTGTGTGMGHNILCRNVCTGPKQGQEP